MTEVKGCNECFSLLIRDVPGVMTRITGLIDRRGFEIETLTASKSREPGFINVTIKIVSPRNRPLETIQKQLAKLDEAIDVVSIKNEKRYERELALVQVDHDPTNREERKEWIETCSGKIIGRRRSGWVVEFTGTPGEIESFLNRFPRPSHSEIARSGAVILGNRRNRFQQAI